MKSKMSSYRAIIGSLSSPGHCPGPFACWPFYKSLLLGIQKTSFRLLSLNRDFQAFFNRTMKNYRRLKY